MKVYKLNIHKTEIIDADGCFTDRYNLKFVGDYLGESRSYGDNQIIDKLVQNLNIKKFDTNHYINNVKKVYRLPHLSLSRDKLKMFQEKCDFKVTRDKHEADIIVASDKYFEKLLNREWTKCVESKEALKALSSGMKIPEIDGKGNLLELYNKIDELHHADEEGCYIMLEHTWGRINQSLTHHDKIDRFIDSLMDGQRKYVATCLDDEIQFVRNNSDKITLDEDINKLCTEDSVVLTKEDYYRIEEILKSSDRDNVSVGLTLMANCNVKESRTYLALLFANHSENMKISNVWNTVNFKYLRKMFEKYVNLTLSSWGNAYDHLIQSMVKDGILTLWSSRQVAHAMFINVLQGHFGVGQEGCVFTISEDSLELKPEIAEKLIGEPEEKLSEIVGTGGHNEFLGGNTPNDLPF
jgi:hypothetical protein